MDKTLAANPDNYSVERWNYKRTWDYGSAHYKLDGTTGQEMLTASSAYVSEDGRSVFVAVPGLQKCDQMHLGWSIKSASGKAMAHNAYFTPWNFAPFDAAAEGFGKSGAGHDASGRQGRGGGETERGGGAAFVSIRRLHGLS